MKAIITVGISASGKTTWAEQFVKDNHEWVNINRDDTRFRLFTDGKRDWSKYKFTRKNENIVTDDVNNQISNAVGFRLNIIISDTNLNQKYRDQLIAKLKGYGYEVELKDFEITLEEAWKRDRLRKNGVGHQIMYTQYQKWLGYRGRKTYTPNEKLPKAFLLDIDGTVANMKGVRRPFEWDKVGLDEPIQHVVDMVKGLQDDYYVVCMSGRDEVCRKDTELWLSKVGINYDELFMRPKGDFRKDVVVKEELFWNYVADNYNVMFAVDDRPVIIRLWQELGIRTLCVSNPYIEF